MDIGEIYSFIFGTPAGVGILIGVTLVLCVIIAFLLERRTRKIYADRKRKKTASSCLPHT